MKAYNDTAWRITSGAFLVVALAACVRAAILDEIGMAALAWLAATMMLAARVAVDQEARKT